MGWTKMTYMTGLGSLATPFNARLAFPSPSMSRRAHRPDAGELTAQT